MGEKRKPDFIFGENHLYIDPELSKTMPGAGATYGGTHSAFISSEAFQILKEHCRGDREKFLRYLKAITEFEVDPTDTVERHKYRTPIELEILEILAKGESF